MNRLTVTYYYHSGFSVACGDVLLVFDYWRGEHDELPEECSITEETLRGFKKVYVFISHEHPDHYDEIVYTWRDFADVSYIIAADMPPKARGRRLAAGEGTILSEHVSVRAYDSTDLGVSFLVNLDGVNIFHAGDLNFWHWRDESTIREIDEAEAQFKAAVYPLIGEKLQLAFFPVDPRQGQMYDAGANYFIMSVKPQLLVPMHFWGREDLTGEFARRSRSRQTEIIAMPQFGSVLDITVNDEGGMTVQLIRQGIDPWRVSARAEGEQAVRLENLEGASPFTDTDLPIDLNGGN